jgi:hypothetical protein
MRHTHRPAQPRRRYALIVSLTLTTLLLTAPVSAQERVPGFSTGVTLGAAAISHEYHSLGLSGRVFAEYAPFIHEIGIRLSGGYFRFDSYADFGKYPFNSRERVSLEDTYVTLGGVYRFSRGSWAPFATANAGVYWYQKEDVYPSAGPVINGVQYSPVNIVRHRSGIDFGLNIGGGLEYFFDETLSMSAELLLHSIQGEVNSEALDLTVSFRFLPRK